MEDSIKYIGCDDPEMKLFESQYVTPEGMCYNSYIVLDDKVAVVDGVDSRKTEEWMKKMELAMGERTPDYLIIQHMEPDHSGSVSAFIKAYPEATVVASDKALKFLNQFNEGLEIGRMLAVKDGDTLNLGSRILQFITAPMVHWPEVIMTWCPAEKTLFSADGFGKFGVMGADADDWACEARRYYFNICGKYGLSVSAVLKKAAGLDIRTICPLHGPVLEGDALSQALRLYSIWSSYSFETDGVLVAHASIHGNTAKVAQRLGKMLKEKGADRVVVADLCRDDMAEIIEDAFRMNRLILCASSYDGNVFPPMHYFLWKLGIKGYQDRTVGIVENGTWAPSAGKAMRALVEPLKNVNIVEPMVTIRSTMKDTDIPLLEALADAVLSSEINNS